MPTYEYVCTACAHEFEEYQSIKADPLIKCPNCRRRKLKRKLGLGGGFIFKGSGFYITDYRSESYKDAAKRDEPSSTKDAAPAAAKSDDSKPTGKDAKDAKSGATPSAPKESRDRDTAKPTPPPKPQASDKPSKSGASDRKSNRSKS